MYEGGHPKTCQSVQAILYVRVCVYDRTMYTYVVTIVLIGLSPVSKARGTQ